LTKQAATFCCVLAGQALAAGAAPAFVPERQLTRPPGGHVLTNRGGWSPDGRWLVCDARAGEAFDGTRIKRIDAATGAAELLYESRHGAGCGMVAHHPHEPLVAFVLGPEHPTADWNYGFSRRRTVLLDPREPGRIRPLDAMNYAPPFAPGALRGGSHLPQFSGDGAWLSFTYDDEVLARLGDDPDAGHDVNQRNVAIAVPAGPVRVARSHPRNHDGDYFCVVVTATVNRPQPGSDEISRAFEEGWIGDHGYVRADGTHQRRALAFLGLVTAPDGRTHAEVFIVDLPDDPTHADATPLAGTPARRPAPPRGAVQRRLTFTAGGPHPGVALQPRHWLRASPDGAAIAFLRADATGVIQLWTVSPNGGAPRQVTSHPAPGVASAFTWSPDGRALAYVRDGSLFLTDARTGDSRRLTAPRPAAEAPLSRGVAFAPDGRRLAYGRRPAGEDLPQIFVLALPAN